MPSLESQSVEEKGKAESDAVFGERERRSARNLPLASLFLGELNERLDPGDLEGLANSIRQVGVLEPLLVRPVGERFEVIAGGRRYRAAKIAGVETVPAVSKAMDDITALRASFHENEERKSASPLEYGMLCTKLAQRCESLREVADLLGKTQAWVESRINAYELYRKADVRLVEKGPGGKSLRDLEFVGPTLGIVDANQIMQAVASPNVRRHFAQVGADIERARTEMVRELSAAYPKLSPTQRKKLLRAIRKEPGGSIPELSTRIMNVSISFNAEVSKRLLTELEKTGDTPETWIRRLVISQLGNPTEPSVGAELGSRTR
jgi:ParB/RepB/Spo0J family partition protein